LVRESSNAANLIFSVAWKLGCFLIVASDHAVLPTHSCVSFRVNVVYTLVCVCAFEKEYFIDSLSYIVKPVGIDKLQTLSENH